MDHNQGAVEEKLIFAAEELAEQPAKAIAAMDRLEDDYGLDTIEMGTAIGVAMEGRWSNGKVFMEALVHSAVGKIQERTLQKQKATSLLLR